MDRPDDLGQFETVQFSKVRDLAERFEQAWEAQQDTAKGIELAPFLPVAGDPLREATLYELIKTDLACRWQRGLPTSLEFYVEKFPELGTLESLSPKLIYEEYRIRTQHGMPAPLSQYKTRFPKQFAAMERIVQSEGANQGAATTASDNPTISPSVAPMGMLTAGSMIGGHYILEKLIGKGGFAEVWAANDTHGNIPKALKIIRGSIDSEEAKQELKALEMLRSFNHHYLLRTEGFFAEQERLIVIMERADSSLREVLKAAKQDKTKGLPVSELLGYIKNSSEALDYLHKKGIFHRDIKPENILLVEGTAKVADFGLAKLVHNRQSAKTNFAGTAAYSSPETWQGRISAKSDQYSLALTYAELRLGRMIFQGSSFQEQMFKHLQGIPDLNPLPDMEQRVLLRALAKDDAERFENCVAFSRALEQALLTSGDIDSKGMLLSNPDLIMDLPTPGSYKTGNLLNTPSTSKNRLLETTMGTGPSAQHTPTSKRPLSSPASAWKPANTTMDAGLNPGRRRRKKGPGLVVGALLGLIGIVIAGAAMAFFARRSLEQRAQAFVEKRDFVEALKEIDNGGVFTIPFKESLKENVYVKGMELAEKAKNDNKYADVEKTCLALNEAFSGEKKEKAATLLDQTCNKQIDALMAREQFGEALENLIKLPINLPVKSRIPDVRKRWLDRAWEEMDQQQYGLARGIATKILAIDPDAKDAENLKNLTLAAENVRGMIQKGQFKEVMDKIPTRLPPQGLKLGKHLRDEVRKAWLESGQELVKSGNFETSQSLLFPFRNYFKDDPEGNALLKSSLTGLFKVYFAENKYEDALTLLDKTNYEFPDLVKSVKENWRVAEVARFKKGDDNDKELALGSLGKLLKAFSTEIAIQDAYRDCRKDYVQALVPKIETELNAKHYAAATELLAKAEPYAMGLEQETQVKSLQLLALVENPESSSTEKKAAKKLLPAILADQSNALRLEQILAGLVRVSVADSAFFTSIKDDLNRFSEILPENQIPKEYFTFFPRTETPVVPLAKGSRQLLNEAQRLFVNKEFDKAFKVLIKVDPKKEADKGIKREFYTLYAKLGEQGILSRDQIYGLEPVLADHPDIKIYVNKAMTNVLAKTWRKPPEKPETWASRLKDCEWADEKNPLVLAVKGEALLETGQKVPFDVPPGQGDQKGFVDYVRALKLESQKDTVQAAKYLEKVSPQDVWLAGSRAVKASKILQTAAIELARNPDKSKRLFASAEDASKAYDWQIRSLLLAGKTGEDVASLSWEIQLNQALASAFKSTPDFDRFKVLGDALIAKHRTDLKDDLTTLVLANPSAFPKEVDALKKGSAIGPVELSGVIAAGESQLASLPDLDELKARQAMLYGLKGWALDKGSEKDPDRDLESIKVAYSKAAQYDPKNMSYVVSKGRFAALLALKDAANEKDATAKIRLWQQGIQAADASLKSKAENDENWADLCLHRSQLALDLANEYVVQKMPDDLKQTFRDARKYAEMARDAKKPHPKLADVWLALGNACEDLARFARDKDKGNSLEQSIEKNYKDGALALDKAGQLLPDYAFNAGRCRFRWANDGTVTADDTLKKSLYETAVENSKSVARDEKSKNSAEASYWEGMAYWYLSAYFNAEKYAQAFDSFDRSMKMGEKHKRAIWARYSFDSINDLIRSQIKGNPSRCSEWLDKTNSAYRSLMKDETFRGAEAKFNDVSAEVLFATAGEAADKKDFAKAKDQLTRVVKLNHSKNHHVYVIERAFLLKSQRKGLEVRDDDVSQARTDALQAIGTAPISATDREKNREEFEKIWSSIK